MKPKSKSELKSIQSFVKEALKRMREESTSAATPGYHTPAAFTGDEDGEGTEVVNLGDPQMAYSEEPDNSKPHMIKLKEVSYKTFKGDDSLSEVQKINQKILEVNRRLREISQALDHSLRLKQESSLDDTVYWKRTNEAISKISKRLQEVTDKTKRLSNINEITQKSLADKLVQLFGKVGVRIESSDISIEPSGQDNFVIDIYLDGEPEAFDYENGELSYQGYDSTKRIGDINHEAELVLNLKKILGR